MTAGRRFWQIPYNGWDWPSRCAVIPIQQAAIRNGIITRPLECSICGYVDPQTTGRPDIALHLERYSHPLEIYPCCRRCHQKLHGRFRSAEGWLRRLERFGEVGDWFHLLSLDPACQWQPFDQTYPRGLPLPRAMRAVRPESSKQIALPF